MTKKNIIAHVVGFLIGALSGFLGHDVVAVKKNVEAVSPEAAKAVEAGAAAGAAVKEVVPAPPIGG